MTPLRAIVPCCLLIVLVGCTTTPTPPARTPIPTVGPTNTAPIVVQRSTAGLPTRGRATPNLPVANAQQGADLIIEAITLVLTKSWRKPDAAILYDAAYAGTLRQLRQLGYRISGDPPRFTNDPTTDATIFHTAYLRLAEDPLVTVNQTSLAYETIRASTDRLDECTTYLLEPAEVAAAQASTVPTYDGIGVQLQPGISPPQILTVYPNTPAAQHDLRPGDLLLTLNGLPTTDRTEAQIGNLLRGPRGTTLTLTIRRAGDPTERTVSLTRETITPPTVTATIITDGLHQSIGWLRVQHVTATTTQEFTTALNTVNNHAIQGWVLDLREARGTNTTALSALAGYFLPASTTIAYQIAADQEQQRYVATPTATPTALPLAVLINGGTSGTAEILAATLADHGRGRLFGEASAGCVAMPTIFPLTAGAAVQIGTSVLLPPSERALTNTGQPPDEIVWSQPTATSDPQRSAALAWLATQR